MTAFEAIRRHFWLFLLPAIIGLGVAIGVAAARTPVYTAEARLAIGGVDLTAPGALSGFAQASQTLAASYSRAIGAEPVVSDVADKVGVSQRTVVDALTAAPVPESPVFRVIAKSNSGALSVALANAAATALRSYIKDLNAGSIRPGTAFYADYNKATAKLQKALIVRDKAGVKYNRDPSSKNEAALADARAKVAAAQLRADALRQNYLTTASGRVTVADLQQLTTAIGADNDRRNFFLIYGFIGLIAGAFAGAALATLRGNRQLRLTTR